MLTDKITYTIMHGTNTLITKEVQYDNKHLKLDKGDIVSVISADGIEELVVPPVDLLASESVFLFLNNRVIIIERSFIK